MPRICVLVSPIPMSIGDRAWSLPAIGPTRWLALPSQRQVEVFKQAAARLGVQPAGAPLPGLMALRSVPLELLGGANAGVARPVTSTFRRLLIRSALHRVLNPLGYFGRVRETAGFPAAVSELLRELKQSCTSPEDLLAAARAAMNDVPDRRFTEKVEEIARVYQSVEESLRSRGLLDEDDLIPEAIRALESLHGIAAPVSFDVVGLHQFTTAQLRLFEALAGAGTQVRVHLHYDEERPFLFTAAGRTLHRLLDDFGAVAEADRRFPSVDARIPDADGRSETAGGLLQQLEHGIFRPGSPSLPADDHLTVLEAPGDYVESEMIALRLHQLHRAGTAYSDCAIVVRSVGEHVSRFRCVMQRFGVPFTASTLEPLIDNPAVQFLVRLFELIPGQWPREDLLRVLRSSFLGMDLGPVDQLERHARSEGILEGPDRWLRAAAAVGSRDLSMLLGRLQRWQKDLEETGSLEWQVSRLRRWAIHALLGLAAGAAQSKDSEAGPEGEGSSQEESGLATGLRLSIADRAALKMANHVARELEQAGRLETLSPDREIGTDGVEGTRFIRELIGLWGVTTYSAPAESADCVRLMDAYEVTPREFPIVFVAGLLEGSFPRRIWEDPFFRDDERMAFRPHGVSLHTSKDAADEERILFYRAITAARERLFLSYPRVTGEGRESLSSFYLDEVRAVVTDLDGRTVSRTLAEVAPHPEEVVSDRDQACSIAVAAGDWRRSIDREFHLRSALYVRVLKENPGLVARLCDGSDRPLPYLLNRDWESTDRNRMYSVQDIESFARCPYQFFAGRRLRLNVDRAGPDRMDQGVLMHRVVQKFLRELGEDPMHSEDESVERLEAILEEELAALRRDAHPYQIRLLRLSLAMLLRAFVERERNYREQTRLKPGHQELAFGRSPRSDAAGEEPDAASAPEGLRLEPPDAQPIEIYGRIDRVDFTPGGAAAVLDYKLGAGRELKEMLSGDSLQIPLYFMALEKVFGLRAAAAFYDSFSRNERKPLVRSDLIGDVMEQPHHANGGIVSLPQYQQVMAAAQQKVVEIADQIGLRVIQPHAEDTRCKMCGFQDVCRVG